MSNLEDYLRMFDNLNVKAGRKPHQPCLLLAVVDLVESSAITDGIVQLNLALRETFSDYFAIVKGPDDKDRPDNPFRYLDSTRFWTLQGEGYTKAEIDSELFEYMQSSSDRKTMRERLIRKWFPDHQQALSKKITFHHESNSYERGLREAVAGVPAVHEATPAVKARDRAFRRFILETYDYRCAASGWRLIIPESRKSRVLVEAAHLIPYAESQDDDPRNGIALTPDFHWALDQNVIAPGPDMKWHVSEVVDGRIADHKPLLDLRGREVIFLGKQSMRPRKDALEYRLENLLRRAENTR